MFQDTVTPTPAREPVVGSLLRVALYLAAAAAWAVLIAGEARFGLAGLCGRAAASLGNGFGWDSTGLRLALAASPPLRLALPWALMVIAMMAPLLATMLGRADRRVLPFAAAYAAVWLAAGLVLIPAAVLLSAAAGPAAVTVALAAALAWQVAPWRRRWLARCRCPTVLGGLSTGLACLGTCWAAMLVPLVAGGGHLAAMAAVSLFLALERRRAA